jgi:predicted transcriptional regulator
VIFWEESRIRASIATNDTTHLEGIDQKISQIENFLDSLSKDNVNAEEKLIHRLSVLAMEKKTTKDKLLHRYLSVGNMDDNTSIANPRARKFLMKLPESQLKYMKAES